jgi:uncharacterized protein YbbC (DUF1343 family)
MLRPLALLGLTAAAAAQPAAVQNGIDVLEQDGFAALRGRKVGLICNHTARTLDGRRTRDVLRAAGGVQLLALFSPEHGADGKLDAKVADAKDERTGLSIWSLYGETRKPAPEQLRGLDTLVFEIQDVGCRFYTYVSTMGLALEAAAEHGLRFVVLDRPNPINGVDVAGPLRDADAQSFTAHHPIPVRHGMTVGELAKMFAAERGLKADLQVIAMRGWKRAMWFEQCGQTWVDPSPNMRSTTQALLYPGVGLLETTNLSVGRGTDAPFERLGAPWLDGRGFAAALNALALPGVAFVPIEFTPAASRFAGKPCSGVHVVVTDRARFEPLATGLALAATLRARHPRDWEAKSYGRLLAHRATLEALERGAATADLERAWRADADAFRARRAPFLLYE